MYVVGIDENGLGPLLGPLVVTAAVFETPAYEKESFFSTATKHLPADDSKKVFGRTRLARAEAMTLAWLGAFGIEATSYPKLMKEISASYPLKRPCSPDMPTYCIPRETGLPYASDKDVDAAPTDVRSFLESDGIKPIAVRSVSICPGSLNLATADPDTNKFSLDFRLMMHLVKEISITLSSDMTVLCGKVGSTQKYGKWFGESDLDAWWVEAESAPISTYRVTNIGNVSFIRDGDASHLPIAVASMIGKYIRELAMNDLNALLAPPEARHASGYRDKVTADFVSSTNERREDLGLADVCFKRNS